MEWRQFLGRFRPAAVPGSAGPGGVPVDRVAEASAELAPVFALLDETEDEVARIVADRADRARRIRADAEQAAAGIEADAAAHAPQARATAARDVQGSAEGEPVSTDRALPEQLAAERLLVLVDRAVAGVRALLGLPDAPAAPPVRPVAR